MSKLNRLLGRLSHYVLWPLLFIYLRNSNRTRVVILAENHILLVKGWLGSDKWGLPGGGLHRNEAVSVGAARELFEETGVTVDAYNLQLLQSEWWGGKGSRYYCHFLTTTLENRVDLIKQRGEIVETDWLPLSTLSAVSHKKEVDRALELLAQRN